MSETSINEAIEHLRSAAELLEISPQHFYEVVKQERPRSGAQRAADDEIDKLDFKAAEWTNRERAT